MFKAIWKYIWLAVVFSLALAACAACASTASCGHTNGSGDCNGCHSHACTNANPYDDNAPITVWIDQPRQPAIDAFLKANPDKASLIKAVVVDREQFPSKVLLFNNTNQGWPDVVFAEPRLVARVADAAHNFPLDLTGWVPADTINNYSGE